MSEKSDDERITFVYQDAILRTCIGELIEETDECWVVKNPSWLNHQLIPKQDPQTGRPIPDPNSPDPRNPRPLMVIQTSWIPFMYVESLEDRETGFIVELPKNDVKEFTGLRPALIETYRLIVMGIGRSKPEEVETTKLEDEDRVNLFGMEE
jgi:hypothetical protein